MPTASADGDFEESKTDEPDHDRGRGEERPLRDRLRVASPDEEFALLSHLRSFNLLLIGPTPDTRAFLAPLMTSLKPPIACCDGGTPELPTAPVGSLVIVDVDELTRACQQQLLEWLNDQGRGARVIATSSRPLFPDVERGRFSDDLYYRLNTVTLLLNRQPDARRAGEAASANLPPTTSIRESARAHVDP